MMKKLLALTLLAIAASAGAQTAAGVATLERRSTTTEPLVVNGMLWRCAGSTCTGPASGDRFGDLRTCKELARKVGAVATFSSRRGALSAEDAVKCNARAAQPR